MTFKKIFARKPKWPKTVGSAETAEQRDESERERWSSKLDFILSTVGYAVGLGNVWRFPYRAYQNGGASFLIPYTATLVLAGLPLFFLEMAFGQFASLGPISVWKVIPIFKGIYVCVQSLVNKEACVGWSMVITSFLCSIYYNMIIAYTLYYLFASFTTQLPWQRCKPDWIEYGCYDHENNTRSNITNSNLTRRLPAAFYWEREVLDMSSGIDHGTTDVKWYLVLCLLLAWIIVCACLIKGIKSSGKVVYFTALFPYVVLVILLIWNVQLDGAGDGIKFYLIPEWKKLARAEVWYSAGTQIFFSLGCGFGTLETMASYNKFKNNVYRDSILVAFINCATSIFAGFVIFSAIGFMAKQTGLPVDKVADGGPGLAFIAYPQGIAMMPVAPLWSCLFFAMLFTLGIDSQFASVETICTALIDEFPSLKVGRRKSIFGLVICAVMFLLGLPQCTRAGIYVMTLFDWYSAGLNLIVISFIETMAISWIYGVKRFSEDIEMMIGHKPNCYWVACWTVLSPIMLMFIFSFTIYGAESAYLGTYVYPRWADGLGWMMVAVSLSTVPAIAAYRCFRVATTQEEWKTLVTPASDWGPAQKEFRTSRYAPCPPQAYPDICAVYRNSHYTLEYLDSNDSSYGHVNIDTKF